MISGIFGDYQSKPLPGATTLKECCLGVDPADQTLAPVVLNPFGFDPEEHDDQDS